MTDMVIPPDREAVVAAIRYELDAIEARDYYGQVLPQEDSHVIADAVLALLPTEAETKALVETATRLGRELGRREAAEEIAAAFEPMLYNSPDGDAFEHTHPKWEGEPECPACWVQGIRQTLAREIATEAQPADSPILSNAARVAREIREGGGSL